MQKMRTLIIYFLTLPLFVDLGEVAVLILARGGSKGLRLKNLQNIGGLSLLGRAIETSRSAGLNDVTVSTDNFLIALEGVKYGANVYHRSYVTATDCAPSIWGVAEFLEFKPEVDIVLLVQATSPFVKSSSLYKALQKMRRPLAYDCVFSATRSHKLRWQLKDDKALPLNFKLRKRPRRQDWDGELLEAGAFYITRRNLVEKGILQNNNCTVQEVSSLESFEVDTPFDLDVAKALYQINLKY